MKQKGFIQATGVALYCAAVGALMFNIGKLFDKTPNFFGPVSFLLLFSVSALTCALLVFYQPYKLFFDNKKKQAADLVLYTTGFLFLYLIVFFTFAVVLR